MKKKKLMLILICSIGIIVTARSQYVILPTGGNASSSTGSMSYSAGQVTYTTYTGTNGSAAQGVQQPYEISIVTAVEEAKNIDLKIIAYPNPTSDKLMLNIGDYKLGNLTYQLYNLAGEQLKTGTIDVVETTISMYSYVTGIYILRILKEQKEIKRFKIVKKF